MSHYGTSGSVLYPYPSAASARINFERLPYSESSTRIRLLEVSHPSYLIRSLRTQHSNDERGDSNIESMISYFMRERAHALLPSALLRRELKDSTLRTNHTKRKQTTWLDSLDIYRGSVEEECYVIHASGSGLNELSVSKLERQGTTGGPFEIKSRSCIHNSGGHTIRHVTVHNDSTSSRVSFARGCILTSLSFTVGEVGVSCDANYQERGQGADLSFPRIISGIRSNPYVNDEILVWTSDGRPFIWHRDRVVPRDTKALTGLLDETFPDTSGRYFSYDFGGHPRTALFACPLALYELDFRQHWREKTILKQMSNQSCDWTKVLRSPTNSYQCIVSCGIGFSIIDTRYARSAIFEERTPNRPVLAMDVSADDKRAHIRSTTLRYSTTLHFFTMNALIFALLLVLAAGAKNSSLTVHALCNEQAISENSIGDSNGMHERQALTNLDGPLHLSPIETTSGVSLIGAGLLRGKEGHLSVVHINSLGDITQHEIAIGRRQSTPAWPSRANLGSFCIPEEYDAAKHTGHCLSEATHVDGPASVRRHRLLDVAALERHCTIHDVSREANITSGRHFEENIKEAVRSFLGHPKNMFEIADHLRSSLSTDVDNLNLYEILSRASFVHAVIEPSVQLRQLSHDQFAAAEVKTTQDSVGGYAVSIDLCADNTSLKDPKCHCNGLSVTPCLSEICKMMFRIIYHPHIDGLTHVTFGDPSPHGLSNKDQEWRSGLNKSLFDSLSEEYNYI